MSRRQPGNEGQEERCSRETGLGKGPRGEGSMVSVRLEGEERGCHGSSESKWEEKRLDCQQARSLQNLVGQGVSSLPSEQ